MTSPGLICHLRESHSEMSGRARGPAPLSAHGSGPSGCRLPPQALSASSHAAIPAPGTAAGSLRAPGRTPATRPALFPPPPRIQTPRQLPGSRTENGMLPAVPTAPSFFPQGPRGCSKFALPGERPRAPSGEGGAGGGGRGRSSGARPRSYLAPDNAAARGPHRGSGALGGSRGRAQAGGPHR